MRMVVLGAVAVCVAAAPAYAAGDPVQMSRAAIVRGDYAAAEKMLSAERRVYPGRPEVLLNLAAVYANTGRVAQAADLYRSVLSEDDVLMNVTSDRVASAHDIASRGLMRLGAGQTASR
jgi:thioredoxin-like negative regulator of GroEL